MVTATNLGYPRLGPQRELKWALEKYWRGTANATALHRLGRDLRQTQQRMQHQLGIQHIPANDLSFYDHVLDTVALVGAVPERYGWHGDTVDLETYFAMARGVQGQQSTTSRGAASADIAAMEMTKWFDTNYHYIVPEFAPGQRFCLASTQPIDTFLEARTLGLHTRPVLLGPVSFLLLGKATVEGFQPLTLLDSVVPIYEEVLSRLSEAGADWVQIDEPCLGLDLVPQARQAFLTTYARLAAVMPRLHLLLATYFGDLRDNLPTALQLPVAALHLDLVRAPQQLTQALAAAPPHMALSLGVVDGRNVWKTDLQRALGLVQHAVDILGTERVLIGPSCSLLHVPYDLALETDLDAERRDWLAFARQKLIEIVTLARAINEGRDAVAPELAANQAAMERRCLSSRIHNEVVKARVAALDPVIGKRHSTFATRRARQQRLNLPLFPTTTIGSFPQTPAVRQARSQFKAGTLDAAAYEAFLKHEIAHAIQVQEEIGLDVLVHGEFERNDMVEYFGEQLTGFVTTSHGWVQSYGSRGIKPPIIYGDVARAQPMTVPWARYAQSLTARMVKGMLTGPVTILEWSFVRDDQPRADTCRQIALAIRDEVQELEAAGITIIQIDEPALRQGLPLHRSDWETYLTWAVHCFHLTTSGVRDETQIHTHMCYAEFDDILTAIAALDADVISLETSRSRMALLDAFVTSQYAHDIGPGLYDVHSPRIASCAEMEALLHKALHVLRPEQIWVNPDCGLKTRRWEEVTPALRNMVEAARRLRASGAVPSQ